MTDSFEITHQSHAGHGRYLIRLDSGATAEMDYIVRGPDLRDFNHTFVPDEFRGSGVAGQLMARAIADARAQGFRIIPTCSYVAAQFLRHPAWADLKA